MYKKFFGISIEKTKNGEIWIANGNPSKNSVYIYKFDILDQIYRKNDDDKCNHFGKYVKLYQDSNNDLILIIK